MTRRIRSVRFGLTQMVCFCCWQPFLYVHEKPCLSSRWREDRGTSKHPFGIFARGEPPYYFIRLLPFRTTVSRRHVQNRDAVVDPAIGLPSFQCLLFFH